MSTEERWPKIWILLICLPFILGFGWRGLNEPDEGRYVEIAREMMTTGNFLVPRIKGVPHYAKPPLTYWAIAGSMKVFGVNEAAVRLPALLAALATLVLIYDLVRLMSGSRKSAAVAVLAMSCTVEFFALSQIVTTDMLHCFLVTLCFYSRWRACAEEDKSRTRFAVIFWATLGFAFVNKGPVPLAVVFLGLVGIAAGERSWRILRGLRWSWGLPLCLALALPWFLYLCFLDDELYSYFLGEEIAERVVSGKGRAQPIYYFLVVYPLVLIPWTPLVGWAFRSLDRSGHPQRFFLGGWIGLPFLLFSFSSSKLWTYMLPLVPPAIMAYALARPREKHLRPVVLCWLIATVIFIAGIVGAEWRATELGNNSSYRALAEALPSTNFRGHPIPEAMHVLVGDRPFAKRPGTKLATWRFRFSAGAFYFLGEHAEYLPAYGLGSLWEWPARQNQDDPLDIEDLRRELASAENMIVLTKRRELDRLQGLLRQPLRVVVILGNERSGVVALTNLKL